MPVAVGDSSRQRGERGKAEEAECLHDNAGECVSDSRLSVLCRVAGIVVVKTGGAYRLAIAFQKEGTIGKGMDEDLLLGNAEQQCYRGRKKNME